MISVSYTHLDVYKRQDKEELDFTDAKAVDACVCEYRPDIIVHAGAIAVTDFCNQHPDVAHRINVDGAVNVAEAAAKYKSAMVFISSEQVFNGNTAGSPFQEEDEAVPNTVYGENKLEAEGLLRNILGELWIARFTWMFGLPERGKNMSNGILWDTLTKLWNQETICLLYTSLPPGKQLFFAVPPRRDPQGAQHHPKETAKEVVCASVSDAG